MGNGLQVLWALLVFVCHMGSITPAQGDYYNELHFDEKPQVGLPPKHPARVSNGALGLPTGCITFAERYSRAKNFTQRRGKSWNPNAERPSAQYVVLVRVHNGLPYPTDLLMHLRALMEEVSEVGMHIFLMYQQDRPAGHPGSIDIPIEAATMPAEVPPELLPITFMFSQQQVHEVYPLVHSFEPHIRDYLPAVYFMNRHQQYRFSWILEYDVRYTGAHWGQFLNSALNLASTQLYTFRISPGQQELVGEHTTLPQPEDHIPDLITFGDDAAIPSNVVNASGEPIWVPRDGEHWNFTVLTKMGVMEMGLSRRLMEHLHDLSVAGVGGYIEEFVPTACHHTSLPDCKIVSVPVALYMGSSNHCCESHARDYYREWYTSGQCRAYALLHPVKLFGHHHKLVSSSRRALTHV